MKNTKIQRQILIIDDHDDLHSALRKKFEAGGHLVKVFETRDEAVALGSLDGFDVIITDLNDIVSTVGLSENTQGDSCLPEISTKDFKESIRAFKICATSFERENFDEQELKNLVETTLIYKAQFVDKAERLKRIHEKIEFEIPSAISLMPVILDYLTKRVEKVGIIDSESSNLFIALDEAFVNAVKHGNQFDTKKNIRITAEISTKEARFTVEDEGEGFDVNSIPDPRDPENLFKSSGRGVLLIHNIMDEVKYNKRGNRVEMIKKSEK